MNQSLRNGYIIVCKSSRTSLQHENYFLSSRLFKPTCYTGILMYKFGINIKLIYNNLKHWQAVLQVVHILLQVAHSAALLADH